jgi:hypothetical protein
MPPPSVPRAPGQLCGNLHLQRREYDTQGQQVDGRVVAALGRHLEPRDSPPAGVESNDTVVLVMLARGRVGSDRDRIMIRQCIVSGF